MSIATAITAAQGKVSNAYTAVSNKGGTLPATQNLSNLPTAINSIPSGGSAPVITSLSVTPTTSAQTITAPSGTDGYSPVTVSAVTSSIDANITAGNIKKDVSILGVTGTYEGDSSPKYNLLILEDSNVSDDTVSCNVVNSVSFSKSGNVVDINATYPTGNYLGLTQETLSSSSAISNVNNTQLKEIQIHALKTISNSTFKFVFSGCTNLTTVVFSSLETLTSKGKAFNGAFLDCTSLTTIRFPKLKSFVSYTNSLQMCMGCTNLTTVTFDAMENLYFGGERHPNSSTFMNTSIQDIYFPAVTTSSSINFAYAFIGVTGCTLHFPSNVQTLVSNTKGYPNFSGTNMTIAFDLPATS